MTTNDSLETVCIVLASFPMAIFTLLMIPHVMAEFVETVTIPFKDLPFFAALKAPYVAAYPGTKLEMSTDNILIIATIIAVGVLFQRVEKKFRMYLFLVERGYRVRRYRDKISSHKEF